MSEGEVEPTMQIFLALAPRSQKPRCEQKWVMGTPVSTRFKASEAESLNSSPEQAEPSQTRAAFAN